jgi:hypothetical protein
MLDAKRFFASSEDGETWVAAADNLIALTKSVITPVCL